MKAVIRETVVTSVVIEDLDLVVIDEILGENPDGHDYDWEDNYDQAKYWKENEHISIDMLLETVKKIKADGATHVQIVPHCDHRGYHFTGVKLEVMSEGDVIERKKAKLVERILHQEIALKFEECELAKNESSLGDLKKELEKLSNDKDR